MDTTCTLKPPGRASTVIEPGSTAETSKPRPAAPASASSVSFTTCMAIPWNNWTFTPELSKMEVSVLLIGCLHLKGTREHCGIVLLLHYRRARTSRYTCLFFLSLKEAFFVSDQLVRKWLWEGKHSRFPVLSFFPWRRNLCAMFLFLLVSSWYASGYGKVNILVPSTLFLSLKETFVQFSFFVSDQLVHKWLWEGRHSRSQYSLRTRKREKGEPGDGLEVVEDGGGGGV